MSRIVYAWELGAALGHIGSFLPLAKALRARGHTVDWLVTQPDQAAKLLPQEGFTWLQAPTLPERRSTGVPLNYAGILLRFGYAQFEDLLGLVVAWRELLGLLKPDVVLVDHAPTAILAARTLGIPVMLFGSGFMTPPAQSPLPNMRPWLNIPLKQLHELDAAVLGSLNAVLAYFGHAPLQYLAELFQVAETTLLTFPELDHYAQRGPASYWGALPAAVAHPPQWPTALADNGQLLPRVYAYLRVSGAHVEAAFQALQALACNVLVYCPDADVGFRQRYQTARLAFADQPVDLHQAARDAVAGVSYASSHTTTAFLLAGKPLLLLPAHLEQFLLARRVEEMGAGVLLNPEQPPTDLAQKLQQILQQPNYTANAQAFAQKYAAFQQDQIIDHLVNRVEALSHTR